MFVFVWKCVCLIANGEVGNRSLTEQISSRQSVNDWITVGKVKTGLTTSGFTVIIPQWNLKCKEKTIEEHDKYLKISTD